MSRLQKLSATLAVGLVIASPLSALAEDQSKQMDFVLGNFEFVLLHELAHVVIGDNDVPILGPLESAADYTATIMAIRGDGSESAKAFLGRALSDTATTFITIWQRAEARGVAIPYWGAHALSIQRHYSVLCLIYGSDMRSNRDLLKDLPKGRAAGCEVEYQDADRGFQWLLDSFGDPQRVEITFDYGPVASIQSRRILAEIDRLNLLENSVQAVNDLFRFKGPLQVSMRMCGQPEAAWQPDTRELVICYEILDAFAQVYRSQS